MKNFKDMHLSMGRMCKRGHRVTGENAIPKKIAGKVYQQCRTCKNLAEVDRRKLYREFSNIVTNSPRSEEHCMA